MAVGERGAQALGGGADAASVPPTAQASTPSPATGGKLPALLKIFHGMGAIAYGVKDNGFSTFLLIYYNQVLGMDAKLVGLALMLALLVDAVADPIIGYMSDRTYTRWGKRLPWLYSAAIPLGVVWMLLWAPPESMVNSFWYLLAVAIVVRLLVSCCEVPSVALVPELTRDYDERSGLMRWRYLFAWAGGLTIMALAYIVFLRSDDPKVNGLLQEHGYWGYGLCGALLIGGSVFFSAMAQHKYSAHLPATKPGKFSLKEAFSEIFEAFSHKAFLVLLCAGAVAFTSQGVTFSIGNYLYLYVWQFSGAILQAFPVVLFSSVIIAFLCVPYAHKRWGKRETAVVCALVSMVVMMTPYTLYYTGIWPDVGSTRSSLMVYGFFIVANTFAVMTMISASSMVADIVEASEEQTGKRSEGVFFAGNFFIQKCATGLGIFLTSQILSLSGLPERAVPGQVASGVLDHIVLIYGAIVIVAALAAAFFFARFPITRADHEARLQKLGMMEGST